MVYTIWQNVLPQFPSSKLALSRKVAKPAAVPEAGRVALVFLFSAMSWRAREDIFEPGFAGWKRIFWMGSWVSGQKSLNFLGKEMGKRFPKSSRFRKSDAEVRQPAVPEFKAGGFSFFVFGDEFQGEFGHGGEYVF
ncbi:MAG: hypothetical protein HY842_00185 [Bacteroidetes bacterium]|nr:hypothetical protein [Bacteroidota bacterium]